MLICPDCAGPLREAGAWHCDSCGWRGREQGGFPEFLSSKDRDSPLFGSYVENYDSIATDDLAENIQDQGYLRIQAERLLGSIGDIRGLAICEIGVGQGDFFELARKNGAAKLVGVDIAVPYLDRYGPRDTEWLVLANVQNLPFADEFDVVVAADVVEHVLNLGDALLSVHRALRAGGRFVVRVPYKDDLTTYSQQRGAKYDMVHLRDFNKENLKRQLRAAGFELESLRFDGFYPAKKRHFLTSVSPLGTFVDRALVRRYGGYWEVARIGSFAGRLLMVPDTLTAVARKRDSD